MNDKKARSILGINKDEKLTEELIKKKYSGMPRMRDHIATFKSRK